ncbi:MAG: hypothetical protein ABFD13_05025 [Candidatus Cryosericum sp.]
MRTCLLDRISRSAYGCSCREHIIDDDDSSVLEALWSSGSQMKCANHIRQSVRIGYLRLQRGPADLRYEASSVLAMKGGGKEARCHVRKVMAHIAIRLTETGNRNEYRMVGQGQGWHAACKSLSKLLSYLELSLHLHLENGLPQRSLIPVGRKARKLTRYTLGVSPLCVT